MQNSTRRNSVIKENMIRFLTKLTNFSWEIVDAWSYISDKIGQLYEKYIGSTYYDEYKTFSFVKNSKVLHIGCGAYPLTGITLAQYLDFSVIGIDKNPKVVGRARKVVERKELQKKIIIEKGNGIDYPVESFDVIIASGCSLPKADILDHLFEYAKPGCIIIVRELAVSTSALLSNIEQHSNIVLVKQIRHDPGLFLLPMSWNSLYLQKIK